jgi:hypothetical protein
MNDDPIDRMLRRAAQSYNAPPEPPLDEMWDAIERAPGEARAQAVIRTMRRSPLRDPGGRARRAQPWAGMAAALVVGLILGHASARVVGVPADASAPAQATTALAGQPDDGRRHPLTKQYLGQAAALLISLPDQLTAELADPGYVARADALLLETRLLLDAPEAAAPDLRALLEDLEIVLAQVVRLEADGNPMRFELLRQALEQRDVLPRVRDAVVHHIAE